MLKAAGFTGLKDKEKRKINWKTLWSFVKENEETIRALFKVKRFKGGETFEEEDKQSLIKYVNAKLEMMLACKFEASDTQRNSHFIQFRFQELLHEEELPD